MKKKKAKKASPRKKTKKKPGRGGRRPGAGRPAGKKTTPKPSGIQGLAEVGAIAEDIILQLGLENMPEDERKEFDRVVAIGHAKHRNKILTNLSKQADRGTTTATKAQAVAFLKMFQGVSEDFDEDGLKARIEAEIDRAKQEKNAR